MRVYKVLLQAEERDLCVAMFEAAIEQAIAEINSDKADEQTAAAYMLLHLMKKRFSEATLETIGS